MLVGTVVESVRFDETADEVVVSVRPDARARGRCGRCGRRSTGYDGGDGRRRWRALDAGTTRVFIEADAPRVRCRAHGQTVAQVPWARHDVGHTRDFDAMAAWLTVRTSRSATCQLLPPPVDNHRTGATVCFMQPGAAYMTQALATNDKDDQRLR